MYFTEEEIALYLEKIENVMMLKENLNFKNNDKQKKEKEKKNESPYIKKAKNDEKENDDFFSFQQNLPNYQLFVANLKAKEEELNKRECEIETNFKNFQTKVNAVIRNKNRFLLELNKKDEELKYQESELDRQIEKVDEVSFRIMNFIDNICLEDS